MARIRVLDDVLVNRIAAGEVVERPASVVKELIDNSLDAGSRRIEVELGGGGKRAIRVRDDGEGMERDDALLALERHATSKLRVPADLERIETLGFRGEALPSIASVSRFLLQTSTGDGPGTEVEVRGGRIMAVRQIAAPRGTVVEVGGLFFNTPARRKFLKSDATENGHVARVVSRAALMRPDVAIRLMVDGRVALATTPGTERLRRIEEIYGADLAADLLPVTHRRGSIQLEGFVTRPASARAGRSNQHLFVNGRAVSDRMLLHALAEGFSNTTSRDRFPAAFLFLEIDPGAVDVNVHPQKAEVRFARPGEIHDAVVEGIRSALGSAAAVPAHLDLRPSVMPPSIELREARPPVPQQAPPSRETLVLPETDFEPRASVVGQFDDSYILAADESSVLVVDQHAAHERVLFERYLAQAQSGRVETQRLLFPLTLPVSPHEASLVEEEADELARLGFAVEPFGPGTIRLDGVPAVAAAVDPETLFRGILGEARRIQSLTTGVGELRRALVTNAACQAAIKIHHRLTPEGMQRLLDDLLRAENPTTCPHGRPILFRLTREEIERTFRRR